jgi:RimJ/RimL family protein N-acetyltransferase
MSHRETLCRMEEPPSTNVGASLFTTRLRLEPVGPANAPDLWLVHKDDTVWPWYGSQKPELEQAERQATSMGDSWRFHGVHKWIAYDRVSGEVVGRGGLSRTPVDEDWGQIYAFLPAGSWVRAAHESHRPFIAHANWLEIGWALRRNFWGTATRPRSAMPDWRSHSMSSAYRPLCHAQSATTIVHVL